MTKNRENRQVRKYGAREDFPNDDAKRVNVGLERVAALSKDLRGTPNDHFESRNG